ncbi:MAG: hypothetical protein FD163_1955 [Hyphomonadaceae bacterium]|nr:MAG: hypothetical protein FD163_1955 [Hyphomonadaceae bacterium]
MNLGNLRSAKAILVGLFATIAFFLAGYAYAAPNFPALSGRVVDQANIIPDDVEATLVAKLTQMETESSDQVVVVTLNSLDGYEIEEYGYQLGRNWGIGQKDQDNGILLIVAPNERKVRIEVGYGLEGVMPDILANQVIQGAIIPKFRAGDMVAGIVAGVDGIDAVLKATPEERADRAAQAKTAEPTGQDGEVPIFLIILIIFYVIIIINNAKRSRFNRRRHDGGILPIILHDWDDDDKGGGFGGFGGGGFGGGGGFSGGGGSFGGGGSSGSW